MKSNVILKLDLDRWTIKNAMRMVNFRLRWIDYYFDILPARVSFYKTNKGLHCYIDSLTETVLPNEYITHIQRDLESDWLREVRNLKRLHDNMTSNWNLMFNSKYRIVKDKVEILSMESFITSYVLSKKGR